MQTESEAGIEQKESMARKGIKLLIKIIITIVCFWYISTKIDFTAALQAITKANFIYLTIALLFFILSKVISSYRLNIYFRNIGLQLSEWTNMKLYWLGMFYNLFLPGAISGDAYKVVLLNRKYKSPYKKTSAAVLLDRLSGVLALGVILSVYGIFVIDETTYDVLLAIGTVIAIVALYFLVKVLFKDFLPGFAPTFFWGLAVQASQVVCIYFILLSLKIPINHEWIFIFLASAVISILPLSLGGGLGTREVVFAEGARFFHLDPQTGVVISLLFYLLTVIGSLPGLYFNFHDPMLQKENTEI